MSSSSSSSSSLIPDQRQSVALPPIGALDAVPPPATPVTTARTSDSPRSQRVDGGGSMPGYRRSPLQSHHEPTHYSSRQSVHPPSSTPSLLQQHASASSPVDPYQRRYSGSVSGGDERDYAPLSSSAVSRQSLPSLSEALASAPASLPPTQLRQEYAPTSAAAAAHRSQPHQRSPAPAPPARMHHQSSQSSESSANPSLAQSRTRSPSFNGHLTPISPVLNNGSYPHAHSARTSNGTHAPTSLPQPPPLPASLPTASSSMSSSFASTTPLPPSRDAAPWPTAAAPAAYDDRAHPAQPYPDSTSYSRNWRPEDADPYQPATYTPADAYRNGHHSENVKRYLETYDLDSALNEINDSSRQLLNFGTHYAQKAHNTVRSGPLPGSTPNLAEIDGMMKHGTRVQESLNRMRSVVLMQQAALQERSKEQAHKTAQQAEHGYSDDGKLAGFAGSDPKKRRGRAAPPGRCHSCNRAETPEWRRGPDGARTLCNACGLHYAKLTRRMGANKAAAIAAAGSSSNLRPKLDGQGSAL